MLDIEIEEELVQKIGGKFALTSLIQKRLAELNRGELPLIEVEDDQYDPRIVVCQEILQGKIALAPLKELEAELEEESPKIEAESPPEEEEGVEIYGSDIKKIKEQRIKELSQLLNPKTT
jgi:DNA-directed RNA polymerase subunit omega